jgi:DNA-binding NtrC family response regulator
VRFERNFLSFINQALTIRRANPTRRAALFWDQAPRRKGDEAMKVLTVGTLNSRLTAAGKLAADKGAAVVHAADIAEALAASREGVNLIFVDVAISVPELVRGLEAEHAQTPIIACGTAADASGAAAAIRDGAKGYISLATDLEPIAAVLATFAEDMSAMTHRDGAKAGVIKLAQQAAASEAAVTHVPLAAQQVCGALVGRTVGEVERDLILETLKHCVGNRTHAANLLGISIRTLRNKLNEYTAAGLAVPPPGGNVSSDSRKAA